MENKKRIRPLTPTERKFAEENHQLIEDFLKRSRLDIEEFYDVVVLDFLLAVEVYLNDDVQYMYISESKGQARGVRDLALTLDLLTCKMFLESPKE